ncbi:MAG: Glutamate--tRNA ligase 2 [Pseudomonadota bacterium]|jgi:glutamyl-tRNA synthetase
MAVTVRFAPSPTGRLHVGNIRTALFNWMYARRNGGQFILRLDDTDLERSTEAFAQGIREDLMWLGLVWDREERQTARLARYDEVVARLKASGRLYPCYETEDELDRRRKRLRAMGRPPMYDRAALRLTADDRAKLEAEGRQPHWRFRLANTEAADPLRPVPTLAEWLDLVRGDQSIDVGSLSDPVLIRADGTYLYTLTSVIDDIDMGITDVIRGEDHVTNTGVQIQLFEALSTEPPRFGHHNLLVGADGQALSKRAGALSIEAIRAEGLEPMAVASHAALIGTSDAIEPFLDLATLAGTFDFARISRAPARFDMDELRQLNARYLHHLPYDAVANRLAALGVGIGAPFWEAVKGNILVLSDVTGWWQVVDGQIAPVIEDAAFLATAAGLLPEEPFDETTWKTWTDAVKAATGAKGRALFHPLRLALTGREQGPELKLLLPLIGRQKALSRLAGNAT